MKQHLNKWLKISHLLNKINFSFLKYVVKQALFKPSCLLCDADITLETNTPRHILSNSHSPHEFDSPCIDILCAPCIDDLPWHAKTSCPQCGLESNGMLCGSCMHNPPDFDATHAVFSYQFPIDSMMQRYKYGNSLNIGDTFGQLVSEKINKEKRLSRIDLIIPMPMHSARIRERGFNQAHEIAKVLAKHHLEKLDCKTAKRIKLTPPQASLPLKLRVKNIKGAFEINVARLKQIQGKTIAIVDDVMTSGASLNELAKTLKKAGATHVECWVVARTLPHK